MFSSEFNLAETILTTLVGLVITVLVGYAAKRFWGRFRRWLTSARNLSEDEALRIARRRLGSQVLDAVPFRNTDNEHQYIAVAVRDGVDAYPVRQFYVDVLEGSGDAYLHRTIGMKAFKMTQPERSEEKTHLRSLYGVLDIDGDGNNEVYAVHMSSGNAFFECTVSVYDSAEQGRYWLSAQGNNRSYFSSPVKVSDNVSEKKGLYEWLIGKLQQTNSYFDPKRRLVSAYVQLGEEWDGAHGKGFMEGPLTICEHTGYPPEAEKYVKGKLVEGEREWLLLFRGPIVEYDRFRNVHFVVYNPVSTTTIGGVVSGIRYLWLKPEIGSFLVAYHKEARTLRRVELPSEFRSAHVKDVADTLFQSEIDIALPTDVNAGQEFNNAPYAALGTTEPRKRGTLHQDSISED